MPEPGRDPNIEMRVELGDIGYDVSWARLEEMHRRLAQLARRAPRTVSSPLIDELLGHEPAQHAKPRWFQYDESLD